MSVKTECVVPYFFLGPGRLKEKIEKGGGRAD